MHDKERIISSQDLILKQLHNTLPEDCVMTGGTALTRFHGFRHRFSEDIDLFMFDPSSEKVLSWLSPFRDAGGNVDIISLGDSQPGKGKDGNVFQAIAVVTPRGGVPIRVDFVEDVFSGCWLPQEMKSVDTSVDFRVDSLEAILHRKLYAVYSNTMKGEPPRGKDAVDLYMLVKGVFDMNTIRAFYREARDIVLPFDSIIRSVAHRSFDLSGIIDLEEAVREGFLEWQEELQGQPLTTMCP